MSSPSSSQPVFIFTEQDRYTNPEILRISLQSNSIEMNHGTVHTLYVDTDTDTGWVSVKSNLGMDCIATVVNRYPSVNYVVAVQPVLSIIGR